MTKKVIINGMSCSHCVARVKALFEDNQNVESVDVDLEKSLVTLDTTLTDDEIIDILNEDYEVVSIN